jgi:ABC-type amino acid transport substrate-binding protein
MRRTLAKAALATAFGLGLGGASKAQAAEPNAMSQVLGRKKLLVGVSAHIKPLAFTDPSNGEIVGLVPDMVALYAAKLGVTAQFNDYDWAGLFAALDTNKVDMLAAHITTTMPRTHQLNLSEPFLFTGAQILTRKELPVQSVNELNSDKFTFGETKGSVYVDVVTKTFPKAKLLKYDSFVDSLQAMKAGRIDASLDDGVIVLFSGLRGNEEKFKVLPENLAPQTYRLACRPGEDEFRRSLDIFLEEIKLTGDYKALYEKWFGIPWEPRQIGY